MSSVHCSGSCKVILSKQKKCYFSSCMNRPQTLFSLVVCFYFAFHLSSILGLFNRQPLGWYPPALSRILQNLLSKTQFTFRSVLKGKRGALTTCCTFPPLFKQYSRPHRQMQLNIALCRTVQGRL